MQTGKSIEANKPKVPEWTINQLIEESKSPWNIAFNNSYLPFAKQISKYISENIFDIIKTNIDGYNKQPTIKSTCRYTYSLDIVKKKDALELQKMAQKTADLEPFNTWFEKFATSEKDKNEKIVEEKANIIEDSIELSSGPDFLRKAQFTLRDQKNKLATDGTYFKEKMNLIGTRVCKDLKKTFNEFCNKKGNEGLNIKVNWLNQGLDLPSSKKSMDIEVEYWIDEKEGGQEQSVQLASEKEINRQKNIEKSNQRKTQLLYLGIATIFAGAVAAALYNGFNPQWLKEQFLAKACKAL